MNKLKCLDFGSLHDAAHKQHAGNHQTYFNGNSQVEDDGQEESNQQYRCLLYTSKILFVISDMRLTALHDYILKDLDRTATCIKSSGLYTNVDKERCV